MSPRLLACSCAAVAFLAACGGSAGESDDAAPAAELSDASGDGLEEPSADPASEAAGGSSMSRCVSEYSAETLKERAFAFDGTVVGVGSESDPRAPDEDVVTGHVQFEVHEWFAGGTGEAVTVWMQRPVEEGDRLLVAGEPRWGGAPLDDAIAGNAASRMPTPTLGPRSGPPPSRTVEQTGPKCRVLEIRSATS